MVQEELTLHQVEGEVVQSPSQDRGSDLVVESLEYDVVVVFVVALPAEDSNALEDGVDNNGKSRAPPDDGVADEVDLAALLAPKVDSALQQRPRVRARVPGVRLDQTGVGLPHDSVKLDKLAQEARVAVVDPLGGFVQLRVLVGLNVPQAVWQGSTTRACDLLLL